MQVVDAQQQRPVLTPPTPASSNSSPPLDHAQVKSFPTSSIHPAQGSRANEHIDSPPELEMALDGHRYSLAGAPGTNFKRRPNPTQHYHHQSTLPAEYDHERFTHAVIEVPEELHLHASNASTPNGLVMSYEMGPPQPSAMLEYSALGRQVVGGGQVQRVMSNMPFAEYLDNSAPGGSPPYFSSMPPSTSSVIDYDSPPQYHEGGPTPALPASHAGSTAYWAQQQDFHAGQTSHYPSPQPSHASVSASATPLRIVYVSQEAQSHMLLSHGHPYFTPGHTPGMTMARAVSATSSTSSTYSDSENVSYTSSQGSDYEGVNPAYINTSTTSLPEGFSSPELPYIHPRPSSVGAAHSLAGLRVVEEDEWEGMTTVRQRTLARDSTVRASPRSSSTRRSSNRNTVRALFAPTPQSMLAPGLANSRRQKGMTTNAPALPTDEEFKALPTKRSRGRRPPRQDELMLEADANTKPSETHQGYVGLTKTGKPKKVFICKVPACGKLFKRSEHLKRHVRSIHTDDKPFQCKWPGCLRLFSRHDNLAQHLRIHRAVGQSDASFAAELEACFGHGPSGSLNP